MWYRLACVWLLTAVFIGLCPSVLANTTVAEALPRGAGAASGFSAAPRAGFLRVQTDLAVPPASFMNNIAPPPPVARIALLLPLRSETLGQAADAVRAGFEAAREREPDDIAIDVIETGDTPQDILSSYSAAADQHDIVVGPLSRTGVAALMESGAVSKPTIALTQPELAPDAEVVLPQRMLVVGLSLEDEARQAAIWAGANKKISKAYVLSTAAAWQRRAAKAFAAQWQKQGKDLEEIELNAGGGYLTVKGLADLKRQVDSDQPVVLFAALDAQQARQVRAVVGHQVPLYGTSQLNPFTVGEDSAAEHTAEMNGARLLDIPWQVQPDHPAVMIYPRPVAGAEQRRSADLERLYALGIDAYRIAREIALKRTSFELDGVTGKITVRFGDAVPFFERTERQAIYRQGSVMTVDTR
jgi:outer membrane PBP1 activator LpoA protein